jgi:general secretion pathway protein M
MIPLTPKQSKAAALALLVAVLLMVLAGIAFPLWVLHRHYDSAIDDATRLLGRYARIAGMREGLQKKIVEVKALGKAGHFLKSTNPALAAAEIQALAKTVVETNGGKLNSMQILPHKDDGLYRQISVTLQLTGTLKAMKKMVYALESSRPYLFMDNFSVRSLMVNAPRNTVPVEPELLIQFDLTGYALKGAQ